jgi:hypothetical protein
MNNVYFTPDTQRANYSRFRDLLIREAGEEFIINPQTLRLEAALSATRSNYSLDLFENRGSDRPLEQKLNRNDLFFLTHIAMGVAQANPTAGHYANFPVYHHGDQNVFIGNDSGGNPQSLEAYCLETLWNSKLTIKTSPVERLKDFLTNNFRYVPENVANTTSKTTGQYGPTMEQRGFYAVQPNIIIDGYDNNTLELDLGAGALTNIAGGINASNVAVNTRNVLVFFLHGFVAINGARKVGQYTGN